MNHRPLSSHSHTTSTKGQTQNASCKQACAVWFNSLIHTHEHTTLCADGWGTRAQFGPDILGQYNTQLLSLITLARTIKLHSAIAHASQGENLFSLLQRHLSPSQARRPARLHRDKKKKKWVGSRWVRFVLYQMHKHQPLVSNEGPSTALNTTAGWGAAFPTKQQ